MQDRAATSTWACPALRLAKMPEEAAACAACMASLAARPFAPSSFARALLPVWYASVALQQKSRKHHQMLQTQCRVEFMRR